MNQSRVREASAADDEVVLTLMTEYMTEALACESRGFAERTPYAGSEIPAELQHLWRFYELRPD